MRGSRTEGTSDQRILRFPESCQEAFRYLSDWSFRVVRSEDTLVRFESDRVFIQVFHGRTSFEIGLEVGLLRNASRLDHDLSAVIELTDPDAAQRGQPGFASQPTRVATLLTEPAELFRQYGRTVAQGDAEVFRRLETIGMKRSESLALRSMVARALEAFRKGDWRTVAEELSSIESVLSPAERKKLEYARRKLTSGD
ncbi:MAG: hypothetical protein RL885_23860 [Planctomycetota bacterium]